MQWTRVAQPAPEGRASHVQRNQNACLRGNIQGSGIDNCGRHARVLQPRHAGRTGSGSVQRAALPKSPLGGALRAWWPPRSGAARRLPPRGARLGAALRRSLCSTTRRVRVAPATRPTASRRPVSARPATPRTAVRCARARGGSCRVHCADAIGCTRRCRWRRRAVIVRARVDRSSCIAAWRASASAPGPAAPRSCSRSHGKPEAVGDVEVDLRHELDRDVAHRRRPRRCRAPRTACRTSRRASASSARHAIRRRARRPCASMRALLGRVERASAGAPPAPRRPA